MFDPALDFSIYLWVARGQKAVDEFLRTEKADASPSERTNLRFHVSMLAVARQLGARVYNPSQVKDLARSDISEEAMLEALTSVRTAVARFQCEHGGQLDKVAKGSAFTEALLGAEFPA